MKKLVNKLAVWLLVCMVTLGMADVFGGAVTARAAAVKLSTTQKSIWKGTAFQLSISGTNETVQWSTSDKKIASLTKVTGKNIR